MTEANATITKTKKNTRMAELLDDLSLVRQAETLKLDATLNGALSRAKERQKVLSTWTKLTLHGLAKLLKISLWGSQIFLLVISMRQTAPSISQLWMTKSSGLVSGIFKMVEMGKILFSTYCDNVGDVLIQAGNIIKNLI